MNNNNTSAKVITKIEQQAKHKNRYSLYIDHQFAFGISEDVLVKHHLYKGMVLHDSALTDLLQAEEQNKADNYALKLLSHRTRSTREIILKMKEKGYDEGSIENTISMLKEHNYIDDKAFALSFTQSKLQNKSLGKNRLKQELHNKGISKDIIDQTLESCVDSDMEYSMALEIAEKKLNSSYRNDDNNAQYRKLGGFLQRKGYDFEIISKVLRELIK